MNSAFPPALAPRSPDLQLAKIKDEPLVNQHFESIDEIEDVLVERCCLLTEMTEEICNLTNYH